MRARGATLVVQALRDEGVQHVFGIPGTHNIELYDALEMAEGIEPVLVTHELSASFMADGVSRTSPRVGVANVVPGAGVTHCLSGVAEAFLDTVPLVLIACGIRADTGAAFQLHDIDQLAVLRPVTKAALGVTAADEIYPTVRRAFSIARRAPAGPVAVEIPADLLMLSTTVAPPTFTPEPEQPPHPDPELLEEAARRLGEASHPALYVGAGASGAGELLVELAERLATPVTTTIQGKGVFPERHPLWLWNGFGAQAPHFVRRIMEDCDCLLAIGCRFGEVATGSYGLQPPANLIHVDISPEVFHRNYPAAVAITADARPFVKGLLELIDGFTPFAQLAEAIADGHRQLDHQRHKDASPDRVSPVHLFEALERHCRPDVVVATDSGNGTFLAMEHLRVEAPAQLIAPVDYSCMGYAVPAAIGAAIASPDRDVVALAGDGALLMTGLELLTAAANRAPVLVCVLRDGKLAQIAQFQSTTMNRETCSVLPSFSVQALAETTGCRFFRVIRNHELDTVLPTALDLVRSGVPTVVEVAIDYSHKTFFTRGVVATNFRRLAWAQRLRMLTRALARRL